MVFWNKIRQKRLRWSFRTSAQRQVEIEDGRFGTVVTKQKTRHMEFGFIYYITPPISDDEFADKVCLWRSTCSYTDGSMNDANYTGDMNDTYEYNPDDVWIPRQDDSYLAPKAQRPLPPIPVTKAVPNGWYDLPEESGSDGSITQVKRVVSLSSNGTVTTHPTSRGSSCDVMYVQDEGFYDIYPISTNNPIDMDQTERKLAYIEDTTIARPTTNIHSRRRNSVLSCMTKDDIDIDYTDTPIATRRIKDSPVNIHHRVSIGPTGPVIIKKLSMPTITWEKTPEYRLDDRDYEENDNVRLDSNTSARLPPPVRVPPPGRPTCPFVRPATGPRSPPIQDLVNDETYEDLYEDLDVPLEKTNETLGNNIHDDQKPEIPPRVPLKAILEQDEVTSETDRRSNASVSGNSCEELRQSNRTCSICENSNPIPQLLKSYHDELHRLLEKEELLRHRDVFDRAKIEVREKIIAGLRKEFHNESQLNKLEKKEQEIEEAISKIGKHTQFDEYYAKRPLRPQVDEHYAPACYLPSRTPTFPSVEAISGRPVVPVQSFKSKINSFNHDFSIRSKLSGRGQRSFSSNMYVPDSGIEAE